MRCDELTSAITKNEFPTGSFIIGALVSHLHLTPSLSFTSCIALGEAYLSKHQFTYLLNEDKNNSSPNVFAFPLCLSLVFFLLPAAKWCQLKWHFLRRVSLRNLPVVMSQTSVLPFCNCVWMGIFMYFLPYLLGYTVHEWGRILPLYASHLLLCQASSLVEWVSEVFQITSKTKKHLMNGIRH